MKKSKFKMSYIKLMKLTKFVCFWILAQTGFYNNKDVFIPVPDSFTQYIHFLLYNGSLPGEYIKIPYNEGLTVSKFTEAFNPSYKTIFHIPGWGEVATSDDMIKGVQILTTAFRRLNKTNLIVLDIIKLIDYPKYLEPLYNATIIGNALAQFFAKYIPSIQTKDQVHLVSHSLGCQVMSNAARSYQILTGKNLSLLTGLDCALAGYKGAATHLRPSDADYVQVIHTALSGTGGLTGSYGTINFFPNGGRFQPFCFSSLQAIIAPTCNHGTSFVYYALSILYPDMFVAKKCTSLCGKAFPVTCFCNDSDTTYMGYQIDFSKRGFYYLKTGKDPPLGLYKEGLNFGLNVN